MNRLFFAVAVSLIVTACVNGVETKPPPTTADLPASAKRPHELHNPFAVKPVGPALKGTPLFDTCGAAPAAIRDLDIPKFYGDKAHSIVEPKLLKNNRAAVEPLHEYFKDINRMVEAYAGARPPNSAAARCALTWLASWAKQDALLGTMNEQGQYEQKWTLGILAMAYLRVRDVDGQDATAKKDVEAWFRKIAAQVQPLYRRPERSDNRNNHAYWAGMAVAAAGLASDDAALFQWGVGQFDIFVAQENAKGLLPLELDRKARALHYHAFAAQPLAMLAWMAGANGIDLASRGKGSLGRLVDNVLKGYEQPEWFAQVAGEKQEPLKPNDIVFLEFYSPHKRDPAVDKLRAVAATSRDERFGGKVGLLFEATR